jgi:hypothetical protein
MDGHGAGSLSEKETPKFEFLILGVFAGKIFFLPRILVVIIRIVSDLVQIVAGYFETLLGPRAEIDQLAAIRAKRPVRIIFPQHFLAASRALYDERHTQVHDRIATIVLRV